MKNLHYIISILLVLGWILGFFVWNADAMIHLLLILAIIFLLLGIIRK